MSHARNLDVAARRNPDRRALGVARQIEVRRKKMFIISSARVVVAMVMWASAPIVHAAENADRSSSGGINRSAAAIMPPPMQAPVGHRQPRVSDIPATTLSPFDLELRRENALVNQRIIICRGC
jgi:hypothetical protein